MKAFNVYSISWDVGELSSTDRTAFDLRSTLYRVQGHICTDGIFHPLREYISQFTNMLSPCISLLNNVERFVQLGLLCTACKMQLYYIT